MKNDNTLQVVGSQPQDTDSVDAVMAGVEQSLNFNQEFVGAKLKVLMSHTAATNAGMVWISIDDIHVEPGFNIRTKDSKKTRAHVRKLANLMLASGYAKDKCMAGFAGMRGKKPVIILVDGHCRLEAVKLANSEGANISVVPMVISDNKETATTMEDMIVAQVTSNESEKLTPFEVAIACKRLIGFGWKVPMIATKIGKTQNYVTQLLELAGSPKAIRDAVEAGETTAALAVELLHKHGADAPQVLKDALVEAKANGKTKVTAKFLPDRMRIKAFKKAAPAMFTVIEQVKAHNAFNKLPTNLQAMIDDIIAKMPPIEVVDEDQIQMALALN